MVGLSLIKTYQSKKENRVDDTDTRTKEYSRGWYRTYSADKKGCEALIIHFCFPCPISGRFFVLHPLIDRGRGFQRGSEHLGSGANGRGGEKIRIGN